MTSKGLSRISLILEALTSAAALMSRKGRQKTQGTLQRSGQLHWNDLVSYWWYSASQKIIGILQWDHLYLVAALRLTHWTVAAHTRPSPQRIRWIERGNHAEAHRSLPKETHRIQLLT